MVLVSCGKGDCNAYKTTKYKRVGAHHAVNADRLT